MSVPANFSSRQTPPEMPAKDHTELAKWNYIVEGKLGSGRSGVAYKGVFGPKSSAYERDGIIECAPGQPLAIKYVNRAHLLRVQPDEDFYGEARRMLEFDNPYIVKLYNVLMAPGFHEYSRQSPLRSDPAHSRLYIFMEFADNGDLKSFLEQLEDNANNGIEPTKVLEDQVLTWCRHVLLGLQYLHANQVAHNDLHYGNVFLFTHPFADQVIAKIGDFGRSLPATPELVKGDICKMGSGVCIVLFMVTEFRNKTTKDAAIKFKKQLMADPGYATADEALTNEWIRRDWIWLRRLVDRVYKRQ